MLIVSSSWMPSTMRCINQRRQIVRSLRTDCQMVVYMEGCIQREKSYDRQWWSQTLPSDQAYWSLKNRCKWSDSPLGSSIGILGRKVQNINSFGPVQLWGSYLSAYETMQSDIRPQSGMGVVWNKDFLKIKKSVEPYGLSPFFLKKVGKTLALKRANLPEVSVN